MFGLHFVNGAQATSIILGLAVIIFFVVAAASGVLRSPRRRRFRSAYPLGRPYWNQGFGLSDPAQQLNAVMAASFQKRRVLSGSEYRVFKIIEDEMATWGKGHRVFAQTCLGEVLQSSEESAFRSINSKRADILVVDRGGWPILAVEYQGEGHYQNMAAARDVVKKEALRKAGVRHLEVHPTDSDDEIRSRVRAQLGWKAASPTDRSFTPRPPLSPSPASLPASTRSPHVLFERG
jgi:Protein of unknown function (DUF2726)